MRKLAVRAGLALAIAAASGSALAHHSFAIFDSGKLVTLNGTVKEFQWTNPHSVAWVQGALSSGGAPQLWALELTAPSSLTRMGWDKRSLKPGDQVSVEINPLRDGSAGGALKKVTFRPSGAVLTTHSILSQPLKRGATE